MKLGPTGPSMDYTKQDAGFAQRLKKELYCQGDMAYTMKKIRKPRINMIYGVPQNPNTIEVGKTKKDYIRFFQDLENRSNATSIPPNA